MVRKCGTVTVSTHRLSGGYYTPGTMRGGSIAAYAADAGKGQEICRCSAESGALAALKKITR